MDYKIVALRLSCIIDRSNPEEKQAFGADYPSAKVQVIKRLLHDVESQVRVTILSSQNGYF